MAIHLTGNGGKLVGSNSSFEGELIGKNKPYKGKYYDGTALEGEWKDGGPYVGTEMQSDGKEIKWVDGYPSDQRTV